MPAARPVRISPKPGINNIVTQTENADGYFASNLIRWRLGKPEKLGGWLRLIEDVCAGFIRALHPWEDLSDSRNLLLGTDGGLQIVVNGALSTMTLASGTVSGGETFGVFANFSAVIGTTVITVGMPTDWNTGDLLSAGDVVTFALPVSVGGRILTTGSTFTMTSVATDSFTFNMASNALYTENLAVGIPLFSFDWTNSLATVTFRRHGLSPGGTFHVDQTTSLDLSVPKFFTVQVTIPGGTDLSVVTTPTTDTFTFNWTPFGTAADTATPTDIYEGQQQSGDPTGGPSSLITTFGVVLEFVDDVPTVTPLSQDWFLDNLGEDGLIVFTHSALYVYHPPIESGARATAVGASTVPPTAPQKNHGMFVAMPQAQVIVWGTEAIMGSGTIDPLLVRWSDAGTFDTWEAAVDNQAGSYRLSKGSRIMGGIQAPQTTLLLTDTDVWSMAYQGPPLIYGFTIMGSGCGLLATRMIATVGRSTYWPSLNGFWMFGERGLTPLVCPIWDKIFRDLDMDSIGLAFAGANTGFNEVSFFYPSLEDAPDPPTNVLIFSQVFDDIGWSRNYVSITDGLTAPDATSTASRLVENTQTAVHGIDQVVDKARTSLTYTFSVYARNTSTRWGQLSVCGAAGGAATGNCVSIFFNPVAGTITGTSTTGSGWSIVASGATTDTLATGVGGNGWVRYYITVLTGAEAQLDVEINNVTASTTTTFYEGNGTSGLVPWGAQVNLGALAAYEETTNFLSNNPTRYVKYNVAENLWDFGKMPRTAWTDQSLFGTPLAGDFNFRIQQHELGFDDDTGPMRDVFIETGYASMADGANMISLDQVQPDMTWFGNDGSVNLIFKTVNYPGGPQGEFGPYPITRTTQFFSTRIRAKQVALRYEWAPVMGYSARVGGTIVRIKPSGTRP